MTTPFVCWIPWEYAHKISLWYSEIMTTRFAIMVFSVDDIVHIHIYHCLQKGDWNTLTGKKFKNKNEKKNEKIYNINFVKPKSVWVGLETWIENYTFQILVYMYTTAATAEKLPDTTVVLKLLFSIYKYKCNFCCREGGHYGGGGAPDLHVMWSLPRPSTDAALHVWSVQRAISVQGCGIYRFCDR